jgi:hypothetical protein
MTLDIGKPLDQYPSERRCSEPSCSAMLSRYNPNPTCSTHGGWREHSQRRRRRRAPEED